MSTPKPSRATGGPKAQGAGASGTSARSAAREPAGEMASGVRIALFVLLVLFGVLVAVAGVLVQSAWFPGGLLLALLGAAGVFYGGARALRARSGAYAPAASWLVAVLFLSMSRPEGDLLFGSTASSYLYLLGGMAVAVMCATLGAPAQPGGLAARLAK